MPQEEPLDLIVESIRNDLTQVGDDLQYLAHQVIEEDISAHPIFIASHDYIDIGKPIFDRDHTPLNWFFNATILEDFIRRDLIKADKVPEFRRAAGDPKETAAIFVIVEDEGRWVFVPYDILDK